MTALHIQAIAFVDQHPQLARAIAAVIEQRRSSQPSGLTPKQQELLAYITYYMEKSGGVSPSYTEMATAIGVKSKSTINRVVESLVDRGHVRKALGKTRAITLVRKG